MLPFFMEKVDESLVGQGEFLECQLWNVLVSMVEASQVIQMGESVEGLMPKAVLGMVKTSTEGMMGEFLRLKLPVDRAEFLDGQAWNSLVDMVRASLVRTTGEFLVGMVGGFLVGQV